jgi:S1-C subfamily serine protease
LISAVLASGLLLRFCNAGAVQCPNCDPDWDTPSGQAQFPNDDANYEAQQLDLDDGDVESSWIGVTLSGDRRLLKSGGYINGLVIVGVQADSPAAHAGLRAPTVGAVKSAVEMAAMAAGFIFPPAMLAVGIVNSSHIDETYDMIIGVDGDRVINAADFQTHLQGVEPGERVYLNIVRNGARLQVPVSIPPGIPN